MQPDLFEIKPIGDASRFPVGQRVMIQTDCTDFHFFRIGEGGTVVRSEQRYLGVRVALDRPRRCDHGHYTHDFGEWSFNPSDLGLGDEPEAYEVNGGADSSA